MSLHISSTLLLPLLLIDDILRVVCLVFHSFEDIAVFSSAWCCCLRCAPHNVSFLDFFPKCLHFVTGFGQCVLSFGRSLPVLLLGAGWSAWVKRAEVVPKMQWCFLLHVFSFHGTQLGSKSSPKVGDAAPYTPGCSMNSSPVSSAHRDDQAWSAWPFQCLSVRMLLRKWTGCTHSCTVLSTVQCPGTHCFICAAMVYQLSKVNG